MGAVYNRLGGKTPDPPVLINKTISSNGTYNASSDNADGYARVITNVRGTLTQLWSGEASGDISVDLSGYNWIEIETNAYSGATGSKTLLQVGGAPGSASVYFPYQGSARGYCRVYQATASGITALTPLPDDGVYSYRIIAIYGIPNLD